MNQPERWISHGACDSVLLSAIVCAELAVYVPGLGFYSDDWPYLAAFSLSPDQTIPALFRAVYEPWVWMRPAQQLHFVVLYRLFGTDPVGYHVMNGLVLLGGEGSSCRIASVSVTPLRLPNGRWPVASS